MQASFMIIDGIIDFRLVSAGTHLLAAITVIILPLFDSTLIKNSQSIQLYQVRDKHSLYKASTLGLQWVVFFFFFLTAVFQFYQLKFFVCRSYIDLIRYKYLEYSITFALSILCIAAKVGIVEVYALVLIFFLIMIAFLIQWILDMFFEMFEMYIFSLVCLVHAIPWALIITTFFQLSDPTETEQLAVVLGVVSWGLLLYIFWHDLTTRDDLDHVCKNILYTTSPLEQHASNILYYYDLLNLLSKILLAVLVLV